MATREMSKPAQNSECSICQMLMVTDENVYLRTQVKKKAKQAKKVKKALGLL